jgi:hypothetical protein
LTDKQSGLILFAGVFAGPQDLLTHTLVWNTTWSPNHFHV